MSWITNLVNRAGYRVENKPYPCVKCGKPSFVSTFRGKEWVCPKCIKTYTTIKEDTIKNENSKGSSTGIRAKENP